MNFKEIYQKANDQLKADPTLIALAKKRVAEKSEKRFAPIWLPVSAVAVIALVLCVTLLFQQAAPVITLDNPSGGAMSDEGVFGGAVSATDVSSEPTSSESAVVDSQADMLSNAVVPTTPNTVGSAKPGASKPSAPAQKGEYTDCVSTDNESAGFGAISSPESTGTWRISFDSMDAFSEIMKRDRLKNNSGFHMLLADRYYLLPKVEIAGAAFMEGWVDGGGSVTFCYALGGGKGYLRLCFGTGKKDRIAGSLQSLLAELKGEWSTEVIGGKEVLVSSEHTAMMKAADYRARMWVVLSDQADAKQDPSIKEYVGQISFEKVSLK